jgi:hypothetical protein
MPTQSIDLSAVTEANFNGSAVEQINLNGVEVWTKPATAVFQKKIGSGAWVDVPDNTVVSTYRQGGDMISINGVAYHGRAMNATSRAFIEGIAGQSLPVFSIANSTDVFMAISKLTSTGFAPVTGMVNISCYKSAGYGCNQYGGCQHDSIHMFQNANHSGLQWQIDEGLGAGNAPQSHVNGILQNINGNLKQYPAVSTPDACPTDYSVISPSNWDEGIMWGNSATGANGKTANTNATTTYSGASAETQYRYLL